MAAGAIPVNVTISGVAKAKSKASLVTGFDQTNSFVPSLVLSSPESTIKNPTEQRQDARQALAEPSDLMSPVLSRFISSPSATSGSNNKIFLVIAVAGVLVVLLVLKKKR